MRAFLALASALWRYSAGRRAVVVLYALMFATANAIWLFEPFVVGKILNNVQLAATGGSARSVLQYLALFVALSVGFWLFHGPARVMERATAFHIRAAFKEHLYSVITSLPLQWHKNHHSGRTINRIAKATNSLFDFSETGWQIIEMLVRPIGALIALTLLLPAAAGFSVIALSSSLLIVFLFDRVLFPIYDQINEKDHHVASALHDYLTNITTVITLRLEQLTRIELVRRMMHYLPVFHRENRINETKWFFSTMAIAGTTALVLGWYAITTMQAGELILAGTFYMLYEYLQRIGQAFYTFAWKYGQIVEWYANLKTVYPILHAERAEEHRACNIPADWKSIEIQGLDFTYKDEEKRTHHLKDVSITLERGKRIALVGESGSGKSTIMTLIRGLHPVDKATVLCDGEELKHGLKDVGSSVTLIPQEPEIFENTVEYNITLDTSHRKTEIMDCVELARFSSVLKRLPRGLKTNTAEKGVNLSGGEKQRLALARGIFAAERSSIILLDEPTSSVDSANERAIYEGMFKHFQDRCIVSSVHKLHLLPMFDHAYVFRDGQIISEGTPDKLLNEGGVLHELWMRERRAERRID